MEKKTKKNSLDLGKKKRPNDILPASDADMEDPDSDSGDDSDDPSPTDDYSERHTFTADPKQSPIRLDKFVNDRLSKRSRNKIQNAIRAGAVKVNDLAVKPNFRVKPGHEISVVLPKNIGPAYDTSPQEIPLHVVYEDEDVMVINKPAGLAVHPGVGIPRGTLVNAIAWHLQERTKDLPTLEGNGDERAGLVHRIDKDTTGLMVIAKNDFAMTHLANQFFYHTIERKYWALVWGDVDVEEGTIVANIGRNPNNRKVFMTFLEGDQGKHAVTHYKVIERFYYVTLIECTLETGRTHQIRVHMKHLGHTLFSDTKYGGNHILKGTVYSKYKQFVDKQFATCPRQALHARVLGFTHPRTGEHLQFELDPPSDMMDCVEQWRTYVKDRKAKKLIK